MDSAPTAVMAVETYLLCCTYRDFEKDKKGVTSSVPSTSDEDDDNKIPQKTIKHNKWRMKDSPKLILSSST